MIYLKRLAAVTLVFVALVSFLIAFPVVSLWYVASGVDLSDNLTKYFIGKRLPR